MPSNVLDHLEKQLMNYRESNACLQGQVVQLRKLLNEERNEVARLQHQLDQLTNKEG